jgi:hypothetical protein
MAICLILFVITIVVELVSPSVIGKPYWHPIAPDYFRKHHSLFIPSTPTLIAFALLIFGVLMPEEIAWGWHRTILITAVMLLMIDLICSLMFPELNLFFPSRQWWESIGIPASPRIPTLIAMIILIVGVILPSRLSYALFPRRR